MSHQDLSIYLNIQETYRYYLRLLICDKNNPFLLARVQPIVRETFIMYCHLMNRSRITENTTKLISLQLHYCFGDNVQGKTLAVFVWLSCTRQPFTIKEWSQIFILNTLNWISKHIALYRPKNDKI